MVMCLTRPVVYCMIHSLTWLVIKCHKMGGSCMMSSTLVPIAPALRHDRKTSTKSTSSNVIMSAMECLALPPKMP